MIRKIFPQLSKTPKLFLVATFSCVLLSWWKYSQESVINPDAICYLLSAETFNRFNLTHAMELCGQAKWPFYSVLIASIAKFTSFSMEVSAYLLNGMFSLVSVLAFISLLRELGGSNRVLWLGAGVILLSNEFNRVREYIIRDHGFWAFYLLAILLLIHFAKKPTWGRALLWSACSVVATLFRIEGLFFLLLMPFAMSLDTTQDLSKRVKCFFQLNALNILCGVGLFLVVMFNPHWNEKIGRLPEIIQQFQQGWLIITARWWAAKQGLIQHVLTMDSIAHADLILSLLMICWYVALIVGTLSAGYTLLFLYGIKLKLIPLKNRATRLLVFCMVINLVITALFLLERFFLSKRYLMALCLILMLWVPFALDHLLNKGWCKLSKSQKGLLGLTSILVFCSALGGVGNFGYSKAYIQDSGRWLATNLPKNTHLYANDFQLMYYSQVFGGEIFKRSREFNNHLNLDYIRQFQYVALRMDKKNINEYAALLTQLNVYFLKEFSNARGDKVMIYNLQDDRK